MRNSGEVVNFCLRLFFQHPWLDYIYKIIVGDLYHHVSSFKKATLVPTPVPCCNHCRQPDYYPKYLNGYSIFYVTYLEK